MMKKLLLVALCGLTALTFAGCGSTKNDTKTTAINTETNTTVVTNDTVTNTEQATSETAKEDTTVAPEQAEASTDTGTDSMYIKDGNLEFHNTTGKNWYADVKLAGGVTAHFTQIGDDYNLEIEGGNRDDYSCSVHLYDKTVTITYAPTCFCTDADLKELK